MMSNSVVEQRVDYNQVVLVDEDDNELGVMDKLEAHTGKGTKHRAISVMLWRRNKIPGSAPPEAGRRSATRSRDRIEVLLQKRSKHKLLWPLYWADTCSTHPVLHESYEASTVRRLKEELGIEIKESDLELLYKFSYQVKFDEKLSENELDAVLVGEYDGDFVLNKEEVVEAKWVEWGWLVRDVDENTDEYAAWFVMMVRDKRLLGFFKGLAGE